MRQGSMLNTHRCSEMMSAELESTRPARRDKRAVAQAALRQELAALDTRHAYLQKDVARRRREARRRTSESTDTEAERRYAQGNGPVKWAG